MPTIPADLVSAPDLAEMFHVNPTTIRGHLRRLRMIKYRTVGSNRVRYSVAEFRQKWDAKQEIIVEYPDDAPTVETYD